MPQLCPRLGKALNGEISALGSPICETEGEECGLEDPSGSHTEDLALTHSKWRGKWQPIPVFLLENSMDRGAWWATVRGVSKNWTRLSQTQLTLHLHKVEMTNGINDCHS